MKNLFIKKSEMRLLGTLFLILLSLLTISKIFESRVNREGVSAPLKVAENPFDIELTAKAAYVYDVRTKTVLFAKNENTRLPLASLTKVMSALVATEIAPANSTVVVSRDALDPEGDSGLKVGDRWSLKNLLDFSLTSSSNDGIHAVALALGALDSLNSTSEERETDFVSLMNQKAGELDMKNTYYFNETGLDLPEENNGPAQKAGAYGTAKDMATLYEYIFTHHPELFEATRKSSVSVSSDSTAYKADNTDTLVDDIPGVKASKTGFTDLAGGNLVIAFDPELGRPIIVAVLGSTEEARFQDVKNLIDASIKSLTADYNQ